MPSSGETRTLHDPDVAIMATTKTMMARPRNATKYSDAERPRRLFLTAAMVHQFSLAPPIADLLFGRGSRGLSATLPAAPDPSGPREPRQ